MKINFGSTYKDVEQLLRASLKPTTKADDAGFEKSLGSLLSQPVESPKKNAEVLTNATPPASPKSPMEEVKASYRFDNPGLMMPDLGPLSPPETPAIPSENGGMSVKTPTLLDARRVTLEPTKMMSSLEPKPMALQSLMSSTAELTGTLASAVRQPSASRIELTKASEVIAPLSPKVMPPQLGEKEIVSRLSVASQKVGLDPSLAMAVVKAESGFNVRAVSADGHYSKGLFQLLDTTGKHLLSRAETPTDQDYDPFDPDLNIQLGTSYLRYLHDIFRTPTQLPNARTTKSAADDKSLEQLAVAAFNAGEGRVAAAQHRTEQAGKDPAHYDNVAPFLPRSTREYVARVVGGKRLF
jgi:soluble lytic murein transglycosylase-like protein